MPLPPRMTPALLTGHDSPRMLALRAKVPVPRTGAGEVLIRVAATALNSTDGSTRIGWYSQRVEGATADPPLPEAADDSWSGVRCGFPAFRGPFAAPRRFRPVCPVPAPSGPKPEPLAP